MRSDRPTIHVVAVTDRNFLPWCACTLLSATRATPDAELVFHVLLGSDVSTEERQLLIGPVEALGATATCATVDEAAVAMLPSKGPALGGRMSWVRVTLPDALPDVDRVVYLDADTLVRTSLVPLADALGDAPIAAVCNVTEPAQEGHVASLGLAATSDYFNAGVLVADLSAWRAERATEQLIEYATSRPLPWFDQDALNVVFNKRWRRLHPKWNAMNSLWGWRDIAARFFSEAELDDARRDPAVLHFEGPAIVKPWHYLSQHPFRSEYRDVLAATAWASRPLDERTLMNRLIALLPERRWLDAYARLARVRARLGRS